MRKNRQTDTQTNAQTDNSHQIPTPKLPSAWVMIDRHINLSAENFCLTNL